MFKEFPLVFLDFQIVNVQF